jgi:hypothetical protein
MTGYLCRLLFARLFPTFFPENTKGKLIIFCGLKAKVLFLLAEYLAVIGSSLIIIDVTLILCGSKNIAGGHH